jgi:tetratricopeptide (TPR) repeat protein
LPEPAATQSTSGNAATRGYSIERFYTLVAGASEDRIVLSIRDDLRCDAMDAAYTVEAWLEEINGREEKYDRLANLARSVAPIADLLRTLSSGVYAGCYADLMRTYEEKCLRSFFTQRDELRQNASEVEGDEQLSLEEDLLTTLTNIVSTPEGRDDYVAWFQIGWLQWKAGVLDDAENAFRTAASFSQRQSTWYFSQCLRHEAFVQWRRENFERARSTIRRALEVRRDPIMLVEAARYAMSCGQTLESQSLIDEALHSDPLIFVTVLADPVFASSITSTMDILVRQQSRSADAAKSERLRWNEVIQTLRTAEKQGSITLLPEDADAVFVSTAIPDDVDFPTAIYRAETAKTYRLDWAQTALEALRSDVALKKQELDTASELLRTGKGEFNTSIDSTDKEQRNAEIAVQEEHQAVQLPVVPQLSNEFMQGLVLGLVVLAVGSALLALLSQWRFGSIPPLQPLTTMDMIVVSPILILMALFGVLGAVTFPAIRIAKARKKFDLEAGAADQRADDQLRAIANEGNRKREAIKHEWAGNELQLHSRINEAQRLLRASTQALNTVKQLN